MARLLCKFCLLKGVYSSKSKCVMHTGRINNTFLDILKHVWSKRNINVFRVKDLIVLVDIT